MTLIVQKYGGTSVGDIERIRNVARRVVASKEAGHQVVVCVSAMAGETDQLIQLAQQMSGEARLHSREYDTLVSTGEQKTIALLAMAIRDLGHGARSLTGAQMGMKTEGLHARSRILDVDSERLRSVLADNEVCVIAGFQGVNDAGDVTTLGRGGSDTSAVAVACALGADVCEIFTDVDGIYTADPQIVPDARKLDRIAFEEMIELASLGAKVLQIRSVKFAMRYKLPIHVRSSFALGEGTWVVPEEDVMERLIVSGVTCNSNEAKIRLRGVPDQPGIAARLFGPIGEEEIVVDMILQNYASDGTTDMTFTVPRGEFSRAMEIAQRVGDELECEAVQGDEGVAKVSIVGLGMKDHAGVASKMFDVMATENINIQMIGTSEIKISIVIEEEYAEAAVRALHEAFLPEPGRQADD